MKNTLKAKELLNQLLKKHLENNLINLELNNQREITTLSIIKNTSNTILNYLSNFTDNSNKNEDNKEKKHIIIPKIKLDINNNHNKSQIYNNEKRNSKKEELYIEIDGILKNKKHNNTRNREEPISSILLEKNTNKSKVSFIDTLTKHTNQNKTPDKIKRHRPFINNYTSKKKEKNFIKKTFTENNIVDEKRHSKRKKRNGKNSYLTERNEKNKDSITSLNSKKAKKNNISFNLNNNQDNKTIKSKFFKKGYKTSLNFYSKNNKSLGNNSVNEFKLDESNDYYENKIMEDEQNLKNMCDSLLKDVDKDELLVSNSKIIFTDIFDNEKNPFSNEDNNEKIKNQKIFDNFKTSIQYFLKYLQIQDILNLYKTKKEILKIIINIQIKNTQKTIDEINSIFSSKNININDSSFSKNLKPFELNTNSIKAISLLNSISKANFIKSIQNYKNITNINNKINIKKIILIFDLYFIALGKKKDINNLNDNYKKLDYICNYFKNNKNKLMGIIIENDLKGKKFNDYIINSLYEYSYKYINIINPNYYKKINKDIAILVFLIKNILDFVGMSYNDNNNKNHSNNKNNEQKLLLINKSRLNIKNILLDKYNKLLSKF